MSSSDQTTCFPLPCVRSMCFLRNLRERAAFMVSFWAIFRYTIYPVCSRYYDRLMPEPTRCCYPRFFPYAFPTCLQSTHRRPIFFLTESPHLQYVGYTLPMLFWLLARNYAFVKPLDFNTCSLQVFNTAISVLGIIAPLK